MKKIKVCEQMYQCNSEKTFYNSAVRKFVNLSDVA